MSIVASFAAISETQLKEFLHDPDAVKAFLRDKKASRLTIDKAWQGIHFLLTGEEYAGKPPLAWAVMGGKEIGPDGSYGPSRYLTAVQVMMVAEALKNISTETFCKRFDPQAMTHAGIYPAELWDQGDEALAFLLMHFEALNKYYQATAAEMKAMLLSMA